jgi:hypothetical protein
VKRVGICVTGVLALGLLFAPGAAAQWEPGAASIGTDR